MKKFDDAVVLRALRQAGGTKQDGASSDAVAAILKIKRSQASAVLRRLQTQKLTKSNGKRGTGGRWWFKKNATNTNEPKTAVPKLASMSLDELVDQAKGLRKDLEKVTGELERRRDEYSELFSELLGRPKQISSKEKRRFNEMQKNRLVALLEKNPNRGFSPDDLMDHLGNIEKTALRGLLGYLTAGNIAEKIGDAYRLKAAPKPKRRKLNGRHSQKDSVDTQARILDTLKMKPITQDELRKVLNLNWPTMKKSVQALTKEGLIKSIPIPTKSANGKNISPKKLVLSSYRAEA